MIRNLITPAEYRKEKAMQRMARELDIPFVQAFYQVEVIGPDGKLIDGIRSRSHSWVRNAYNMMLSIMAQKDCDDSTFEAGKLSAKDTNGTLRYGNYPIRPISTQGLDVNAEYGFRAGSGIDTYGTVVGSDDTSESFEHYALVAKIANGTGAGQLTYVAQEACAMSWASPVLKATWIRYFNNNSGGTINVKEIAIIAGLVSPHTNSGKTDFMLARDKLGATVSVPNTGQLKVTYEITLTYP